MEEGGRERKEEGREGRRRAHTNSTRFLVSIAFSRFSGPGVRWETTAEPHMLTLNRTRSATLLGGAREGGGGGGGGSVGENVKVSTQVPMSGYEGEYEIEYWCKNRGWEEK